MRECSPLPACHPGGGRETTEDSTTGRRLRASPGETSAPSSRLSRIALHGTRFPITLPRAPPRCPDRGYPSRPSLTRLAWPSRVEQPVGGALHVAGATVEDVGVPRNSWTGTIANRLDIGNAASLCTEKCCGTRRAGIVDFVLTRRPR